MWTRAKPISNKRLVILSLCVEYFSENNNKNNSNNMYRFIMERKLFSQLRQQWHKTSIGMTKRYYQCGDNGVYGYRPRKVEPFTRKSLCVPSNKKKQCQSVINDNGNGSHRIGIIQNPTDTQRINILFVYTCTVDGW